MTKPLRLLRAAAHGSADLAFLQPATAPPVHAEIVYIVMGSAYFGLRWVERGRHDGTRWLIADNERFRDPQWGEEVLGWLSDDRASAELSTADRPSGPLAFAPFVAATPERC